MAAVSIKRSIADNIQSGGSCGVNYFLAKRVQHVNRAWSWPGVSTGPPTQSVCVTVLM